MHLQDFIAELHCPCCGSGFQEEIQFSTENSNGLYGIIRCACYRYPIIEGILVLKQVSGSADTRDRAIECIEAGDLDGALYYALSPNSAAPRARKTHLQEMIDFLGCESSSFGRKLTHREQKHTVGKICNGSLSFRQAVSVLRPTAYADYLYHRYANNSFLASIAPLLLLNELHCEQYGSSKSSGERIEACRSNYETSGVSTTGSRRHPPRVLDFACGVGHASFLIASLFPELSVIAADHDFANLYLARRYLIPNVACLCIDAEIPLPFEDKSFDAVFCLDGLHYIRSKVALLSELDRVLQREGLWLFPHLHNAMAHNVSPGIPLALDDYQRCFEFLHHQILPEADVLRDFIIDQSLDLSASPSSTELRQENVFSLIGSRRRDLWRKHSNMAALLWRAKPALSINPIYRVTNPGKTLQLKMEWPNAGLEEECAVIKKYLPQEYTIDSSLWKSSTNGMMNREDEAAIQSLINSFVLVHLPRHYSDLVIQ